MKLKHLGILFICISLLSVVNGCEEEERDTDYLKNIPAPSNIALLVQLAQDNSGLVTLTPSGNSVAVYTIDFGDGTPETVDVLPGESTTHVYSEGTFSATVTAKNINGVVTEYSQDVVVSFLPPTDLVVTVTPVSGDNFSINVSAEANLAVGFLVYFGDVPNETPTPLMIGETIQHTYPAVGSYELRVIAYSGISQTIEVTQTVIIEDPITLPIDFESTTIEYTFSDFGGATTAVIDNPDPSGINTSSKVAEFFKEPGAEIFAGTVIELGAPIDFSNADAFSIKTWSPQAGLIVKLKIENATDPNISAEIDVPTTAANVWEELVFDFSGEDLSQEYSKVVVFFDFGNPGTGTTFYFDDIAQTNAGGGGGGGGGVALPVDFEDPNLVYTIIGFEGADSALEANPDPSGINTSSNVVRTTKTNGAQFFAGTIVELDVPIDFSTTEKIAIKTWSPKAGIPVRLKLENANASQFVELDVNTSVVNQWEKLVWDFTGSTAGIEFTKVIIFFEFVDNLPGDGSTYYFDDIDLEN
jgi:hypothetical protein